MASQQRSLVLSVTTMFPSPAHAWHRKELTPTSCPHTHVHKITIIFKTLYQNKKVEIQGADALLQPQHSFGEGWRLERSQRPVGTTQSVKGLQRLYSKTITNSKVGGGQDDLKAVFTARAGNSYYKTGKGQGKIPSKNHQRLQRLLI